MLNYDEIGCMHNYSYFVEKLCLISPSHCQSWPPQSLGLSYSTDDLSQVKLNTTQSVPKYMYTSSQVRKC